MKVAFIIVLYKTPKSEVKRLYKEIEDIGFEDYVIYCIDNTHHNKGYSGGVNLGLKQALNQKADLFIVMNPDISLKGCSKENILNGGEHFDIWGGAMKQEGATYYGGRLDTWRLSGGLIKDKAKNKFTSVDFISGSLMIIKKKVIDKIGFFDESYFMYYEDVEYCRRGATAGFNIGIDSAFKYIHFEKSKKNRRKNYYLATNRLRFFLKYSNPKQKIYELFRAPKTAIEIIKASLQKNSFLFNYFSLNSSSFINKVLNFVLFIFLVQMFSPSDYGIYSLVWVHISLLGPILDLGTTTYGIVYLPQKAKSKFKDLFSLRLILAVVVSILTIFLAIVFKYDTRLIAFIILTSAVIFSNVFSGSFLILSSIRQRLHIPSLISVGFNVILVVGLLFALFAFENLGAVFITVFILYSVYAIVNIYLIQKQINFLPTSNYLNYIKVSFIRAYINRHSSSWKAIISRSYVFVLISLFAGLYYKADIFLLKFMQGEEAVGVYSAGYKFFDAFLFLAAAYNIAATPVLAKLINVDINRFLRKIKDDFIMLVVIGCFISLSLFILAPIVFPYFLKGGFIPSIQVLRIVIFALPLILITSIFLNALYVMNKAKLVIYIFIIQTFFNILLNYWFIPSYSYMASAYITVFGELLNVILAFYLFNSSLKSFAIKKHGVVL